MQETLFKQWQDLNQISLDWYRDTSESQASCIIDCMVLHPAPRPLGQARQILAGVLQVLVHLVNPRSATCGRHRSANCIPRRGRFAREPGGIQTSPCTALAKPRPHLSLYTDTTAQYLDFLKQAKGVEDLIATQAHIATGVQDKLKTYSLDCLQIAGSVKAAMCAWGEKALDTAAAQDEKAAPVAAPRRITKKPTHRPRRAACGPGIRRPC